MSLFELFDQLEQTYLGSVIRDSAWLFPVIESFHLIGLAILAGAILLLDLRLLNLAVPSAPIKTLEQDCRSWLLIGISIMLATGIPLFVSEAIKCYYNPFFWIKMTTLVIAVVFTLTIKKRVIAQCDSDQSSIQTKLTAGFSMICWCGVAFSGRWIGFY